MKLNLKKRVTLTIVASLISYATSAFSMPPIVTTDGPFEVVDMDGNGSESVSLSGQANDPDGTDITWYVWRDADAPSVKYGRGRTANQTTYDFPVGTYNVELGAKDGNGEWAYTATTVSVLGNDEPQDTPLLANAGGPYSATDNDNSGFESITLDASASTGDIQYYLWKSNGTKVKWTSNPIIDVAFPVGMHNDVTLSVKGADGSWSDVSAPTTVNVTSASPQQPYNVLFIGVDDLRTEINALNKNLNVKTPFLDQFVDESMVFERAYCQQSVCSASRASLLTGARPDTTGVKLIDDKFRAPGNMPEAVTLPQLFKENGYNTRSIGKIFHSFREDDAYSWSAPSEVSPNVRWANSEKVDGKWPSTERGGPDVTADTYKDGGHRDMTINLLQEYKNSGKKFFLAVGFNKPHLPFCAPNKYWEMYDADIDNIYNARYTDWPVGMPRYAATPWTELSKFWDTDDYVFYSGNRNPLPMPESKAKELIHGYYACVSYIDEMIGQVLAELDRLELRDNTIVVLWGDHGWKLNDYGAWSKQTNFEIDNRVPLIIDAPGFVNGRTKALVELVDMYPTLADLCGLEYNGITPLEGTSMVPVLENPNIDWKDAAFSQYHRGSSTGYSIRSGDYRYTEWWSAAGDLIDNELYLHVGADDLVAGENLAGYEGYAGVVDQMHLLLHREEGGDLIIGKGWKTIQEKIQQRY